MFGMIFLFAPKRCKATLLIHPTYCDRKIPFTPAGNVFKELLSKEDIAHHVAELVGVEFAQC